MQISRILVLAGFMVISVMAVSIPRTEGMISFPSIFYLNVLTQIIDIVQREADAEAFPQPYKPQYNIKREAEADAEAFPQPYKPTYNVKREAKADAEAFPQPYKPTYNVKRVAEADAEAFPQPYKPQYNI